MTVKKCPYCRALRRRLKEAQETLSAVVLESLQFRNMVNKMMEIEGRAPHSETVEPEEEPFQASQTPAPVVSEEPPAESPHRVVI